MSIHCSLVKNQVMWLQGAPDGQEEVPRYQMWGSTFLPRVTSFSVISKSCLYYKRHSNFPERIVRIPLRIIMPFSSEKQEGECYFVKIKCTQGFLYMSVSFQGGFLDHRMARCGHPRRMSLTTGQPGLLIVLAYI